MSDEIDAVSRSERGYSFALNAFQTPADHADNAKRSVSISTAVIRMTALFALPWLAVPAALALWTMWHTPSLRGDYQSFWDAILGVLPFATILGILSAQSDTVTREHLQVLRGTFALRQAAAAQNGQLAPTIEASKLADSDEHKSFDEPSRSILIENLQRADAGTRGFSMLAPGILFLLLAIFVAFTQSLIGRSDGLISMLYDGLGGLFLLVGALFLIRAYRSLRSFTIIANEQDIRLSHSSSGVGSQPPQAGWSDARGFITFRVSRNQKKSDIDAYYLLDTTTKALAWRITPKTPSSVREAHERFVQMANEHVQLRDITASLKDLLESPETRSYEYAITALSGPAPVPPAVRKVLTTPVRESHFLRGYLIVAAILLGLLVAAGLLLQSGFIPAGSF